MITVGAGDLPMLLQYLPAVMATNCLGASTHSGSENQAPTIFSVVVFVCAHRSHSRVVRLPSFETHHRHAPCRGGAMRFGYVGGEEESAMAAALHRSRVSRSPRCKCKRIQA